MAKKTLTASELKQKKQSLLIKKYVDLLVGASKLNKYEKTTANTGYLKTIILSTATTQQAAEADANRIEIDLAKDFLVKSGSVIVITEGTGADAGKMFKDGVEIVSDGNDGYTVGGNAYAGPRTAGKYIDMVINVKSGSADDEHIYINVQDLVDVYTAGNGLSENAGTFALDLDAAGGLQLTGSTEGAKKLAIKIGTANGLSIDANGLNLALATQSSAGAMSAADKKNLDQSLLTDAEMASWFGWDITGTPTPGSEAEAVKAMLEASNIGDSIEDEA